MNTLHGYNHFYFHVKMHLSVWSGKSAILTDSRVLK